jgi:hypothetical protein
MLYRFFYCKLRKSQGKASGIKCNVGMFQRPERIFSLGLASIFSPLVSYYSGTSEPVLIYFVISIMALGTLITSVYRVKYSFDILNRS